MKICLTIDSLLLQYMPHSRRSTSEGEWEVMEGTTVAELVAQFNFSEGAEVLSVVNGVCCIDRDRPIREGDAVVLLPLIAGG